MNSELIIDVQKKEINIALLRDKKLIELSKQKSNTKFAVGDIYLGKVKKIMPGLNAAFIDVGYQKDAFLHYLDLGPQFQSFNKIIGLALSQRFTVPSFDKFETVPDINKNGKITEVLKSGQTILIQIAKEPISSKGPRLTSELSIAGRNIVLLPFSNKISVSQKIRSSDERNRLRKIFQGILPNNYGVIVRTAASNKRIEELDAELTELVDKWEEAIKKIKHYKEAKLLIGELDRTSVMLRDIVNSTFNNIYINNENIYKEVKDYISTIIPEKQKIVKYYSGRVPIFEQFEIDRQIKASFGKTVGLKNGSYLIIEHTEALHSIDVNSGNRPTTSDNQESNALDVNILAAEEIARQLRLRDMGGIIVIDFIDMTEKKNRLALLLKMKELMSEDPAKHTILPLSRFGLMQITRQRFRPQLTLETHESCPSCKGSGKITASVLIEDEIENNIKYLATHRKQKSKIILKTHPFLASYLTKGFWSKQRQWCWKHKVRIRVKEERSYHFLEYRFFDFFDDEIMI